MNDREWLVDAVLHEFGGPRCDQDGNETESPEAAAVRIMRAQEVTIEQQNAKINAFLMAGATITNQNSAYEEQNQTLRRLLTELCNHVEQDPADGQAPDLHGWDIVKRIRSEAGISTGNAYRDGCTAGTNCESVGMHWVDCPKVVGCTNPDHENWHPFTREAS